MNGIARSFMAVAVVSVVLGMSWGIQMAASGDHMLSPAHAHLNLVGWVSFSIFAFYYHLFPEAAQSRLAKLHFALSLSGVVLLVPGIVLVLTEQGEVLAKLGSVLSLAGILVFAAVVLRTTQQDGSQARTV
jgi:heme/copper-type cytochrome/quinol oxidase subunit 1